MGWFLLFTRRVNCSTRMEKENAALQSLSPIKISLADFQSRTYISCIDFETFKSNRHLWGFEVLKFELILHSFPLNH